MYPADSGENGFLHNARQKAHPMHGDAQAIAYRQARHQHELNVVNQRFDHARMLKHWGLGKLNRGEGVPETLRLAHCAQSQGGKPY